MTLIEYFLIFSLLLYIAFLHYQLMKKNMLIKDSLSKLTKIENSWNKDQIIKFLKKLQNMNTDFLVKEDKILNDEILKFLFENGNDLKSFVHYTSDIAVAERILAEGFRFSGSCHKTAEQVVPDDTVSLIYKHNLSKYLGKYIMVICISKFLYEFYEKVLLTKRLSNYTVEQVLTEGSPVIDENLEEVFVFPKEYIKGFVNYESGEIIRNEHFNADYNPPVFMQNVEKLTAGR